MSITDIVLVSKAGGKSGSHRRRHPAKDTSSCQGHVILSEAKDPVVATTRSFGPMH